MKVTDATWMRGSSPLKGALLGLLLQRPGHGYDLANRLDRRLGPAWQIEAKSIYPMLQQLERAGLVTSKRVAHDGPTGQRVVYHPTEGAQDALTAWMRTGAPKEPLRAELQAKLAVARGEDVPRLLQSLDCYERDCTALLAASSEEFSPVGSFAGLAMTLTRVGALTRLRAELEWIALARKAIAAFEATQAHERSPEHERTARAPARRPHARSGSSSAR